MPENDYIYGIKCVDLDYRPEHRKGEYRYFPGETITADDWNAGPHCGNGLHFSPSPSMAQSYVHSRDPEQLRG